MTARLSPAEARKLGIDVPGTKRTRRTARAPYHTRCVVDGEMFTTEAAEDRHLAATRHARYELVTG